MVRMGSAFNLNGSPVLCGEVFQDESCLTYPLMFMRGELVELENLNIAGKTWHGCRRVRWFVEIVRDDGFPLIDLPALSQQWCPIACQMSSRSDEAVTAT